MSEEGANVYHLVAFMFEGKDRANEVVKEIKKNKDMLEGLKVVNSVVIRRNEEGKVKFSEIRGMSTKKGLGWGAGTGLVLGILGSGGLLAPVLLGSAAGAGIAKHHDKKELSKEMQEITDAMHDDSSALLAILQDKEAEKMIDEMEGFNANVVTVTLGDEESQMVASMVAGDLEIDAELLEEGDEA